MLGNRESSEQGVRLEIGGGDPYSRSELVGRAAQQIEDNERGLEVVGMLRAWWHAIAASGGNPSNLVAQESFQAGCVGASEAMNECDR